MEIPYTGNKATCCRSASRRFSFSSSSRASWRASSCFFSNRLSSNACLNFTLQRNTNTKKHGSSIILDFCYDISVWKLVWSFLYLPSVHTVVHQNTWKCKKCFFIWMCYFCWSFLVWGFWGSWVRGVLFFNLFLVCCCFFFFFNYLVNLSDVISSMRIFSSMLYIALLLFFPPHFPCQAEMFSDICVWQNSFL